jgi:RNA polymerase sigma-70 factor (ECF subfamily)
VSYRVGKAKGAGTIDTTSILHALFCQYSQPICRYLARLTGDPGRAEELTQEVFLRAFRELEAGARWENPRAWLYRVASRLAINDHRRRTLFQWLPLRDSDPDPAARIEAAVAERLAVQEALAQLAPKYRVPLVLYLEEGYSVSEIAEILVLSKSAVKVRLYRAREQFRRAYRAKQDAPSQREVAPRVQARKERP